MINNKRLEDWSPYKPKKDSMRFIWSNLKSISQPSTSQMADNILGLVSKHINGVKWEGIMRRPTHNPSVSFVDLLILQCLMLEHEVSNVIEIGMGSTTVAMCAIDNVHVDIFSLGDIAPGVVKRNITYNNMDARQPATLDKMCEVLPKSQFILIDGPHSWEFAEIYNTKFLNSAIGVPIFIHNHYGPHRPFVDGEQNYNQENLFGHSHNLDFYTDIGSLEPDKFLELQKIISQDISEEILCINDWRPVFGSSGLDGPTKPYISMASVFAK